MNLFSLIKNIAELILLNLLQVFLTKNHSHSNSLLLINTGQIGDLLVSSILLENPFAFKKYSKVVFLIKEDYLDLFSNYNGQINIIGFNYKKYKYSILYKYNLLSQLRSESFKLCVNLTAARGILNEEITHLSDANEKATLNSFPECLGFLTNYFNNKYNYILCQNTLNEYQKNIEFLNFLSENKNEVKFNRGYTFNKILTPIRPEFVTLRNAIIISPFSLAQNRDWPKENFSNLIKKIHGSSKIILLGTKEQENEFDYFRKHNSNVEIFNGKINLSLLPVILANAKLFIGIDSGMTHLALKLKVPLIAIIGGGEYGRFFPFQESEETKFLYHQMNCFLCHWQCHLKEKECITKVSVNEVAKEVKRILNIKSNKNLD